ncbi:FAD-binding domain-containing protein [Mycena pura]|uniref:FAD-binding domain-containing protein n=1 Tax=Mycena pura TaxID=153505 RepID=A0AAD6URK9_9AGAR|nr:FAD-binding domain-containing protein [Mycena pura]
MKPATTSLVFILCALFDPSWGVVQRGSKSPTCRNIPGSAGYPSATAWDAFNASISGRLVNVVPSAKYCANLPGGPCTDAQWTSSLFRSTIPGAMDQINWEQGYDLNPPSLCLRNATTCGQGDVPVYSVEAETVADIQAGVKFAGKQNLRMAVKSSGHDLLGRSTAPNSLLIHTSTFQDISFTDAFYVGSKNKGSAVTIGTGVHANTLYERSKENGKIVVAAAAGTVCPAGGYVQGAGHSALSPLLGLGADNALEFKVVIASGELLQVNDFSHPDLFYALRGGGAGSWGVIVSATFRTYPTFNATTSTILLNVANHTVAGALSTVHAQHIFDWDSVHASQYFGLAQNATAENPESAVLGLSTTMPHTTVEQSKALMAPFMDAALALPGVTLVSQDFHYGNINDALFQADDDAGTNGVLGSRLIPEATYRDSPEKVGPVYKKLLDGGAALIGGIMLAVHSVAGKVAENAHVSSAVHPAWRTAKTHVIVTNGWEDSASLAEIRTLRRAFQATQLPVLERLSGLNAGAYSNEGDVLEPHFQTVFFGPNYAKLSAIKEKYDPGDLFIVGAGVGSERWDEWGVCKV